MRRNTLTHGTYGTYGAHNIAPASCSSVGRAGQRTKDAGVEARNSLGGEKYARGDKTKKRIKHRHKAVYIRTNIYAYILMATDMRGVDTGASVEKRRKGWIAGDKRPRERMCGKMDY